MAIKHTAASVRKLAAARWGKVELEHRPRALTDAQKAESMVRREELRAESGRVKAERKSLGNTWRPLREAARFAVDVDAQEPSLSQLRVALERDERQAELADRQTELENELRQLSGDCLGYRYTIWEVMSWCRSFRAGADTLDELAATIGEKS